MAVAEARHLDPLDLTERQIRHIHVEDLIGGQRVQHQAPHQQGGIVSRRGEVGPAHQRDGQGGKTEVASLGRRRHCAGVDDIIPQVGTVIDAGHHHVWLGPHQLVDRQVHAVRRRALDRIALDPIKAGFAEAGDPQRHLQRQGVTRAAAVAIRRHHYDLATGSQRRAEGTNALGVYAIVITDQNSHRLGS
ncbi:hypothetical protein D3C84_828900 [compost metagenome]